jgi:hypothetical protein
MPFNRVYIPVQAFEDRRDFTVRYEDGDVFATVKRDWSDEKNPTEIFAASGASMAAVKPDYKALSYDLRVGQYRYELHTYLVFQHYYVKGMLWDVRGSLANDKPLNFVSEENDKKEVTIKTVPFKNDGLCYEVRVRDISHLRIAAAATVGIALKEAYKGLSEGESDENASWLKKFQQHFLDHGITYDELQKQASEEPRR